MVIYGRGGDRCEHAMATDDLGQVSDRCGLLGVVSGDHPAGQGSGATGPKASRVAVLVLGIGGAMVLFIALWRVEIEQSFEVRPADKMTCKTLGAPDKYSVYL